MTTEKLEGGQKIIDGELIIIENEDKQVIQEVPMTMLTSDQVFNFYRPAFKPLIQLLLTLFGVAILGIIVGYIQRMSTAHLNIGVTRDSRLDTAVKINELDVDYLDSQPAGKTTNRIMGDSGGIMQLLSFLLNSIFGVGVGIILSFSGMYYLNSTLAMWIMLLVPIMMIWIHFFTKAVHKVAEVVNEQSSLIIAHINEVINGINILQVFDYRKKSIEKLKGLADEFKEGQVKEVKMHATFGWNLITATKYIAISLIILYFGWYKLNIVGAVVTAGVVNAYVYYIQAIIDPLHTLFREFGNLQHAIVKIERLFVLLDQPTEEIKRNDIPRFKGEVEFQDVKFAYNEKDRPVLKDINLKIDAGQMVGLVGHTGSGKSTMMNLLVRFYDLKDYDTGKILVDNIDINSLTKQTYRQHVGIILQEPILFKGTLASNIRFGKEGVTDEQIADTLIRIGGEKIITKHEDGLNQEIDRNGTNMSVGEKQLISFARALIYDPPVLILDEATANMDTETEVMIQNAMNVIAQDRTTIVIAHRLSTIRECDQIVVLEKGRIIEKGTHVELIENGGKYCSMYNA